MTTKSPPSAYATAEGHGDKRQVVVALEYGHARQARIAIPSKQSLDPREPELAYIRLELFGVMQALDKLLQPNFELQWKQ